MQIWNDLKQSYKRGNITTRIIYVNIAVFIIAKLLSVILTLSLSNNESQFLLLDILAVPADTVHLLTRFWTIITYQFTHLDFVHIAMNLWFLHIFSRLFLKYYTRRQVLSVYIWGGIWGAILYVLAYNYIPYYSENISSGQMIGASASILAIVVATAVAAPDREMQLVLIGRIKLKYLAGITVFIDLMSITSTNAGGHIAHLGGAIAGFWFAHEYINKNRDITKWIARSIDWFTSLSSKNTKHSHMKARPPQGKKADRDYNKQKQSRNQNVDRILEKVKTSGYNSLSKSEKDELFKESAK